MSGQVFSIMAFWNRNKILSDKELAEGIVRGDEVCYERFFERYYVVVRKFLMSFIGDRAAAEDLAQELFIRLWNRRLLILKICFRRSGNADIALSRFISN